MYHPVIFCIISVPPKESLIFINSSCPNSLLIIGLNTYSALPLFLCPTYQDTLLVSQFHYYLLYFSHLPHQFFLNFSLNLYFYFRPTNIFTTKIPSISEEPSNSTPIHICFCICYIHTSIDKSDLPIPILNDVAICSIVYSDINILTPHPHIVLPSHVLILFLTYQFLYFLFQHNY